MKATKVTRQEFNDTQFNNFPIGAFYYIQEFEVNPSIYHGLIITNQYQLFGEFMKEEDLFDWVNREFPSLP
jgi:hypothetical protein